MKVTCMIIDNRIALMSRTAQTSQPAQAENVSTETTDAKTFFDSEQATSLDHV